MVAITWLSSNQPGHASPSPLHQLSSSSSLPPPPPQPPGASSSRPKAKTKANNNNNNGGSSNMKLVSLMALIGAFNLFLTLCGALSLRMNSDGGVLPDAYFSPPNNNNNNFTSSRDDTIETVLIIATVPYDATHVMAFWTVLECVTDGIDTIVISAPDTQWSRDIITSVMREFEIRSVNSTGYNWKWEAAYYKNDRYDAGLWCDALGSHLGFDAANGLFIDKKNGTSHNHNSRAIFLINDSTIVLEKYTAITNKVLNAARVEQRNLLRDDITIQHERSNVKLVSLNGRLEMPGIRKWYYVESVYRGLTPGGVSNFYNYTCNNMHDCFNIPEGGPPGRNRMSCIVDRYEIGLAGAFAADEIDAMYPSKLRREYDLSNYMETNGKIDPNEIWIRGRGWWWYLYREQNFRFRKIKGRARVPGECLKLVEDDESWFDTNLNLPFPSGETLEEFRAEMIESGANIGKRL